MSEGRHIREIVVAGSGLVGVQAAALVKRAIPDATVVLAGAAPTDSLAERMHSTLPSIVGFHGDLRVNEADVLRATGASFRLGSVFDGWSEGRPPYVHAYGEYGRTLGVSQFHHHWVRTARRSKVASFDRHSPAAMIGQAGRFVHPLDDPASPLSTFEYGLNLDPVRYREMMRVYARRLGVIECRAGIADVRIGANGFVEALRLDDGSEVAGHLFIDCTGPAALVHSRMGGAFEDWGGWLPCDRVMFAQAPGSGDPPPLDTVTAHSAGWRWRAASLAATSHGLVYASAHLSISKAEQLLRGAAATDPGEPVPIRAGRRAEPWLRNCVAIGDAAVGIDPLESTNLHLAHSGLDRMLAKMPDRDFSAVELRDYNRECRAEAERARDFVLLHYVTASRHKDDFWRAAASVPLPQTLAHSLTLFRDRGRLPLYEEETFTRHSWAAVLLGQGVMPRRTDPLIDLVPPDHSERAITQLRENLVAMVSSIPTHGAYLRQLHSGVQR